MKALRKIALLLAVLLLASALTSCSFFSSLFGGDKLSLAGISEMLDAASPKKSKADITAVYADPAVTLTADLEFEVTAAAEKYSYRIDYLLPLEEALATGEAIGEYRGFVTIEGDTIAEDSGEIDNAILTAIEGVVLKAPSLNVANLESHTITEENGKIVLEARARDALIVTLFDVNLLGVTGLSMRIEIDASTERPTSTTLTYTSREGAAVTAVIVYEY